MIIANFECISKQANTTIAKQKPTLSSIYYGFIDDTKTYC